MTIIESVTKGSVFVVSKVGGISELVDDSNGVLIEKNPEEAVNAIQLILSDENRKIFFNRQYYQSSLYYK